MFFVLFFPQSLHLPDNAPLESIGHTLFWRIPALILILLLIGNKNRICPKKDFLALAAALPLLVLIGFIVTFCAAQTGYAPSGEIAPPGGIIGWIAAILLSLSTGFLEEAYFRLYLPERILEHKPVRTGRSVIAAFFVCGLIFALCHAWEGPWGIVNATLAAFVLSLIYIKGESFAGIALAHGLYNIFVFLSAALNIGEK